MNNCSKFSSGCDHAHLHDKLLKPKPDTERTYKLTHRTKNKAHLPPFFVGWNLNECYNSNKLFIISDTL